MKLHFKLFPVFLSFAIILISFFQCSLSVHAKDHYEFGSQESIFGGKTWNDLTTADKIGYSTFYALSQMKVLYNGDFSSFLNNRSDFANFRDSIEKDDGKYISVDENGITFTEDLTSYMKQALIEYAEETNGFRLYPTIDYDLVPASEFKNGYDYKTFRNLVSESGCIIFNTNYFNYGGSMFYGRPFHDIAEDSVSLVLSHAYSAYVMVEAAFYGTNTWTLYRTMIKQFDTRYTDSDGYSAYNTYTSWNEGTVLSYSNVYFGLLDIRGAYPTGSVVGYTFFSTDGRKMKVFKSLNALKNYTAGNRSVYFGSGFYNDPGEIKVSFDDLEKYLDGKYNQFFDDLKDLIGDDEDSLTEEDLEKLVDKILDKMDDTGGGSGTGGDNSGILSEILSTLSGYFDSVLAYLDSILTSVQGLIFVETVKPDDEHMDLSDMINDVWKDPQNGSQAVADSLSASFSDIGSALMAKFPFCIPNDLYSFFSVLTNIPESRAAPMSLEDDGIQAYAEVSAAPRFELPLMIETFGIEEIIVIDMSDFTPLSKNARTFLSLIFAVSLMKFTVVIVGLINDAWGGIA